MKTLLESASGLLGGRFAGRFASPLLASVVAGLALTGCATTDYWSEAPGSYGYDYGYGAPVGWWGQNAVSIDLFFGPLSRYGNWDSYPGYGQVFWPGGIGSGWQPYTRGYWVNDARYGRRWVSSEPFGWATYHYGRWGRDPQRGWFWVPDTRFGGSWVDWRSQGGYASWSALPPSGYSYRNDWVTAPSKWVGRRELRDHVRMENRQRPIERDRNISRPPEAVRDGNMRGDRPPANQQWQRRPDDPRWHGGQRQPGEQWHGGQRQPDNRQWQGGQRPGTANPGIENRYPRSGIDEGRPQYRRPDGGNIQQPRQDRVRPDRPGRENAAPGQQRPASVTGQPQARPRPERGYRAPQAGARPQPRATESGAVVSDR